ncbi:methyltransferase RsmF C-terminal domain-like protein [Alistipes dispar]|uniref:methyltransferase RsmF C-terminal domain-like protein n=1 Tax=Alistipes dispar TaxID=2585119 RepID=UPI003A8395D5
MELPPKFVERVLRDLGTAEGRALCGALDAPPPVSVRLNPAKTGTDRLPELFPEVLPGGPGGAGTPQDASGASVFSGSAAFSGTETPPGLPQLDVAGRVPWCAGGLYLASRPQFTFDSDFHAGAYYVQEASSQAVGHLLGGAAVRGARVLDLCAAPGGKTTLYASLAGPEGLVVANEIDRRRAAVLADNVRKWGTGNVVVTACEPRAVCDFEAWFDVVAVDAPCSGEGMFRKDPASRAEWSEGGVRVCAARQEEILREAWRALKPGGTLLYSTCTFNRDEDEGVLERLLAAVGSEAAETEERPVDGAWGVVCGRVGAFRTYRFYPHRAVGEGFFAAVVRKAPDAEGRMRTPRAHRAVFAPADRTTAAELARWTLDPGAMRFGTVAGTCYGWFAAQADAVRALSEALPAIYSGVAFGQVFRGVLKPDPALAFHTGLNRGALPVAELDGPTAVRYLRRQDIPPGELAEGMNLIAARGRALGFAKRIGRRVNNLYPNSLRIIKQD